MSSAATPPAGWFELQRPDKELCLDVEGASRANGARVIQWPCNGGKNQAWFISRNSRSRSACATRTA